MLVRPRAECGGRAGEQLGVGSHLRVHFQADDDFPVAGGAGDQLVRAGGADVQMASVMGLT